MNRKDLREIGSLYSNLLKKQMTLGGFLCDLIQGGSFWPHLLFEFFKNYL